MNKETIFGIQSKNNGKFYFNELKSAFYLFNQFQDVIVQQNVRLVVRLNLKLNQINYQQN